MTVGYDQPLYLMPFDHRSVYAAEVFGHADPTGPEEIAQVSARKGVVYAAYKAALAAGVPADRTGILVDAEFGAAILRDASRHGYCTIIPTEKSGHPEFDFEHGDDFAREIEAYNPTFAKVLVRHNPEGDAAMNGRQLARLRRLSDHCRETGRRFMFELIVPPEQNQLQRVGGDRAAYDADMRPGLMVQAMHEIQDAGVEPDVWKIEGLDRAEDCARVAAAARRGGRRQVGCVVLGRGEDEGRVLAWLRAAAATPGFTGFAVGRSTFREPLVALRGGTMTEGKAVAEIARRFRRWVDAFEAARV